PSRRGDRRQPERHAGSCSPFIGSADGRRGRRAVRVGPVANPRPSLLRRRQSAWMADELGEPEALEPRLAALDEVVAQFSNAPDATDRVRAADALLNKAAALHEAGLKAEQYTTYAELVDRFGDDADPAVQKLVGLALINSSSPLNRGGSRAEA